MEKLKKNADSLQIVFENKIKTNSVNAAFNQSLYRAEQQLLNETGLPRRAWYKHTLYAPGFYTGYGVKTMPGIREAIEQRNWKEAQEQIEADAKAINKAFGLFDEDYYGKQIMITRDFVPAQQILNGIHSLVAIIHLFDN